MAWLPVIEREFGEKFALTFLDPPFNQGKTYAAWNDNLPPTQYWEWMTNICAMVYKVTQPGGAIYFMQREKNAEFVLRALRETGWTLQNLIIWKKKTSAVPSPHRFSKSYQIIAFATKGEKPRVFNRLRVVSPPPPHYRMPRPTATYLTDVWDDIRELTSGYFAGHEPLRDSKGNRICTQQSPIALLLRIILTSTKEGDWVLDPFAGTGTTLVVAHQLQRNAVGIEIDSRMVEIAAHRILSRREEDDIARHLIHYEHGGLAFTKSD